MPTKEKCSIDFLQLTYYNLHLNPFPFASTFFLGIKFCKNKIKIQLHDSLFIGKICNFFGGKFSPHLNSKFGLVW
jgi:hypothetical protein